MKLQPNIFPCTAGTVAVMQRAPAGDSDQTAIRERKALRLLRALRDVFHCGVRQAKAHWIRAGQLRGRGKREPREQSQRDRRQRRDESPGSVGDRRPLDPPAGASDGLASPQNVPPKAALCGALSLFTITYFIRINRVNTFLFGSPSLSVSSLCKLSSPTNLNRRQQSKQ